MKTTRFSTLVALCSGLALCGLLTPLASAQPAPAKPKAGKAAGKKGAGKAPMAAKPRLKNLLPRMVTATEEQMGKPMTPELKETLTTALRARETAIQAANEAYYIEFGAATGLTPAQAKEIDKPSRATAKPTTEPKVVGKTNMDALPDDEDKEIAPTTPEE